MIHWGLKSKIAWNNKEKIEKVRKNTDSFFLFLQKINEFPQISTTYFNLEEEPSVDHKNVNFLKFFNVFGKLAVRCYLKFPPSLCSTNLRILTYLYN